MHIWTHYLQNLSIRIRNGCHMKVCNEVHSCWVMVILCHPCIRLKKICLGHAQLLRYLLKEIFFLRFHRKYFKMQALDLGIIPSIPVLPLSYIDAYQILLRLGGFVAPQEWQGGLNISYRYGPFMKNNQKVRLSVHSTLSKRSFICDKYSFLFCYLFISEVFYFFCIFFGIHYIFLV